MAIRDITTTQKLHKRSIELTSFALDREKVLVEGTLMDRRFVPVYDIGGEVRNEGMVHHMKIRLLVKGIPPEILDVEAEMKTYPHPECPTTLDSIKQIKGMKLRGGFSEKVRAVMGGVKGCAHLTHLLISMAQEIFAGTMTHRLREPWPKPKDISEIKGLEYLVNSCKVWRKDGPLYASIKEAFGSD